MNRNKGIMVSVMLGICSFVQAGNQLKQVDLHRAPRGANLEPIKLSFYFDQTPKITPTAVEKVDGLEKRSFIFNGVDTISPKAQKAINDIHLAQDSACRIIIERAKGKPAVLTLIYNPKKFDIAYGEYPSIQMEKGIVFTILDREVLAKMRSSESMMLRTASLQKKSVVIDCGHGGDDVGAIGWGNIKEKDVCLKVGLELAQLLRNNAIDVHLSRTHDSTVALGERTSFANHIGADLFVSIHANSAPNNMASGIETYWMRPSLCIPIATTLDQNDQKLFAQHQTLMANLSEKLAKNVHNSLLQNVASYRISDRKIKEQVSQVLLGSSMPAVLVEIGFVSHEKEAQLLAKVDYQRAVARGISKGILSYLS